MTDAIFPAPVATSCDAPSNQAYQLFQEAFGRPRDPRSSAYKSGALDALHHRIGGNALDLPFQLGTAEADAWFAGTAEGFAIWRAAQGEG